MSIHYLHPHGHSCKKLRRALIKRSLLNLNDGTESNHSQEWVDGPCNAPLFGDQERKTGICTSCASGWTHPENYPIEKKEQPK